MFVQQGRTEKKDITRSNLHDIVREPRTVTYHPPPVRLRSGMSSDDPPGVFLNHVAQIIVQSRFDSSVTLSLSLFRYPLKLYCGTQLSTDDLTSAHLLSTPQMPHLISPSALSTPPTELTSLESSLQGPKELGGRGVPQGSLTFTLV
jgi:hypothetical protein